MKLLSLFFTAIFIFTRIESSEPPKLQRTESCVDAAEVLVAIANSSASQGKPPLTRSQSQQQASTTLSTNTNNTTKKCETLYVSNPYNTKCPTCLKPISIFALSKHMHRKHNYSARNSGIEYKAPCMRCKKELSILTFGHFSLHACHKK